MKSSFGIPFLIFLIVILPGIQTMGENRYVPSSELKMSLAHATTPEEKIRFLIRMATESLGINDYTTAFSYSEQAKDLAEKAGMVKESATAWGIMAIIYAELGDYGRSMEINYNVLRLFEKIDDKLEIGVTMGNIGADYLSQKNYKMALDYLNRSLNIARQIGDKQGVAHQYNNIAGIYLDQLKDYPNALHYLKEALVVNKELGNRQLQGINYTNIGLCYTGLKDNDSAYFYYRKGLDIFTSMGIPLLMAEGEILLGKYYWRMNHPGESQQYAEAALQKGRQLKSFEIIRDAAILLHDIYLGRSDSANAYKYAMIRHQATDTLMFLQNQKEIYKLEFQYNYEKMDKARQIKQNRKNYLLGFIIFALASATIMVLLINSRQRIKVKMAILEKEKIESELGFKNKELTINLIALMKKNEMLSDISHKLISIEKGAGEKVTQEALSRLIHEIETSADDKMLKEFSVRFQEVHEGFYHNLLQKYPDLTQSELKLCAFLRLNMSTKDISELTGQRLLTVEHARYRLRKKLGISNSEVNLVSFLSQI